MKSNQNKCHFMIASPSSEELYDPFMRVSMDKSEEPVQHPLYDPFMRVSMDKSEKTGQYPLYDLDITVIRVDMSYFSVL